MLSFISLLRTSEHQRDGVRNAARKHPFEARLTGGNSLHVSLS